MEESLEKWLPVVGYEARYEVSSHGRVRSLKASPYMKGSVLRPIRSCSGRYAAVVLCERPGHRQKHDIHRLVARAFLGPCPVGMDVNHIDGNGWHNAPDNLEYISRSGNLRHAITVLGTMARGSECRTARLTDEDVIAIRSKHALYGTSGCALARDYGISENAIHSLLRRDTWRHLP